MSASPGEPRLSPALAVLLTIVLPGLGHAVGGRARRGAAWIGLIVLGLAVCVAVASRSLWGVVAAAVVPLVIDVAAAVDAARVATRGRGPGGGWGLWGVGVGVLLLVAPVLAGLGLRAGSLETFVIRSGSMCPTLLDGDRIAVDKTAYRSSPLARGDLVVHRLPRDPGKSFVRRVIAVGGDELVLAGRTVSVGGRTVPTRPLDEASCEGAEVFEEDLGTPHRIALTRGADWAEETRVVVPPGHVFLLGDWRNNSYDSRIIGPVPVDLVDGRVHTLWSRGGRFTWQDVR